MVSISRSTRSSVKLRARRHHKGRQPGDARSVKMSAQVAWHFDRYAPPAALEVARRSTVKQITGKNRRIAATPLKASYESFNLIRLFGIFFPLLLLEWRASVLFRQPIFQQNQILDSLNCGAHSGALRPSRISKTYLSIMPCLSRGEICPRPIDEAVSAAISTSVRFSGPRDWRYSWIRV